MTKMSILIWLLGCVILALLWDLLIPISYYSLLGATCIGGIWALLVMILFPKRERK